MTELRAEKYEIPAAKFGPENPLPNFRSPKLDYDLKTDTRVPEEERKLVGWRCGYRVLPYRMQDNYGRVKKPRAFNSIVLENEFIRARVLPELGGRLTSIYDKKRKRELLDCNPVFQPANLALRNAWFSGGIEWNTSHFGHYYLTCSQIFAARIKGSQGEPALRLYEWDRVKCFPWQVDLHLPPDSPFLYARIRLINTHDEEIPMYWWTNMAVPEHEDTRVLVPADTCLNHSGEDLLDLNDMPVMWKKDITYATNIPIAREFYFRIEQQRRRWIAALDKKGQGFFQASTPRLRGRKLFVFGMLAGGRNWQTFLAKKGRSYLEIQAGLATVQAQCVPMPARAEWTWTEAYGCLSADAKRVHSKDWSKAWHAAEEALNEQLPQSQIDEMDRKLGACAVAAPEKILVRGSGWGALERRRAAVEKQEDRVPPEFVFDAKDMNEEQRPWLELLEQGALPERDPKTSDPGQLMIQREWQDLLEASAKNGKSAHWLAWWHIGNMRMEAFDTAGAKEAWQKSLELSRTSWALRNLAVIELNAKNLDAARELLKQAWEAGPRSAPLALEYAKVLVQTESFDELGRFTKSLPAAIRQHERIRIYSAQAALKQGRFEELKPLFDYDFATMREGEVTLSDLWFAYHEQRIAKKEKVKIDAKLKKRVREKFPPPVNIDFRMIADVK